MKIAIFDTNMRKFTQPMLDYWPTQGHEVRFFHTTRRPDMTWADVIWFDCVDGNLGVATRKVPEFLEGKKVIARAIDIDVWASHYNAVDWSKVDHLVFIAPHIRDRLTSRKKLPGNVQVHLVPCGVDGDEFTLRQRPIQTRDVAVVARFWWGKGIVLLLQAIAEMPGFTWHLCGQWAYSGHEKGWFKAYVESFLAQSKNWTHVQEVEDMNQWLEDKTFLVSFSYKEAFSYVTAEALSKGLSAYVHNFYGAEAIWPERMRWHTISELARKMKHDPYQPGKNREFVLGRYPVQKMLEQFDEIITS